MGEGGERIKGQEHTHQIEINTMIHQIIHPRFNPRRRAEIYPIGFAHLLDLLVCAREAEHRGVEFRQVGFQDGGGVACGVAGDDDGEESRVWRSRWG